MSKKQEIPHEVFYNKLEEIVNEMSGDEVLMIPGIYEILAEELNNEVLEELQKDKDDEEG